MVLITLGVGKGDEVILPCTAPIMTVLPIIYVGAKPVFVDSERDNFNINILDLKQKISIKTKLFINVPMWGYANNIFDIVKLCRDKNIPVLEDNSHCHGTKVGHKFLGTYGDFSIFSTHERKLITTGEGAFILVDDKNYYEKLIELRSFGEATHQTVKDNNLLGAYGYSFGLNFKLSAINAALGISQLNKN